MARMIAHRTITHTLADRVRDLGDIPLDRVLTDPPPGTATAEHWRRRIEAGAIVELIDGTLVEKAMSYEASLIGMTIGAILWRFIAPRRLGYVSGADGMYRMLLGNFRGPDVAFISRERMPAEAFTGGPAGPAAPNLVVEVLSPGNTASEMTNKRREYFNAGVQIVWIVDPAAHSVAVYDSPDRFQLYGVDDELTGGTVLPGFRVAVADLFADWDAMRDEVLAGRDRS